MARRQYFVYIMTNRSGTLYTGVTNNLSCRVQEHRDGQQGSFTLQYCVTRIVYYEAYLDVRLAIAREKQLKGWVRRRKVALINSANPRWEDLRQSQHR